MATATAGRSADEGGHRVEEETGRRHAAAPFGPGVRRHIGRTLRGIYAETLTAPPGERIEALLARLDDRKA